ncbi:11533_t:CDS:1 [Dentiscutata heterogama]|uniref:11533_t:CDS:1 n=1 Tax=Dentiscutata heterogama TaxID=1316150 RepID=A0ACA9KW38_9GLOM|nr:11533_t:CDS:1 [Dentiscutata heterogama]
MNRQFFNSLFIIFLIHLLALTIDAKHTKHAKHKYHKYHPQSFRTCTITDISSETVTFTIACTTETPTLSACPDNEQVPDDCDKCEQTTTVTFIPTSTVCAPTCIPDGSPCQSDDQ